MCGVLDVSSQEGSGHVEIADVERQTKMGSLLGFGYLWPSGVRWRYMCDAYASSQRVLMLHVRRV